MTEEYDERQWFFDRRTDKTIFSKRITEQLTGKSLRIASHIVDGQEGLRFAKVKDELVLRVTPAGRYEIKATFLEDDRSICTLTIQRYASRSGPRDKEYFSFVGAEIENFIAFLAGIKTLPLDGVAKLHVSDEISRDIILDQGQARRIFAKNSELFLQLAQYEDVAHDLFAIGYRRGQLKRFAALLDDRDYFVSEQERLECSPEAVWQAFFEANTWIFGYGLSFQFLSGLDAKKLEQTVSGSDLASAGKRTDALMKTRGIISSLCFIEIKRHDTPLLNATQYRSDTWAPSNELAGGVSQVQATVFSALQTLGDKLIPREKSGDPTGEVLFNVEPRSCLVIGSLNEFRKDHGINEAKFRSFELFRRHTWRPEIVTFDELFERARFIVEHAADAMPEIP